MGALVKVLIKAIYNGPGHVPIGWCDPGQVIEIAGGEYATSLIKKGFVTREIEPPVVPQVDEPKATDAARELAAKFEVNLRDVEPTGSGDKIIMSDVQRYVRDVLEAVGEE